MYVASCPCGITKYQKDKILINWCKKSCHICEQKLIIVNNKTNKIIYNFNEDHRSFFVFCPCKSVEFLKNQISLKWGSKVCEKCNKRMCVYVVDINTVDVEFFYNFNKNHIDNDIELVQSIEMSDLENENEKLSQFLTSYVPILPKLSEPSVLFNVELLMNEDPIDIYEKYNNMPSTEIDELVNSFANEYEQKLLNDMYTDYIINI